ncbi:hypothetical protein DIU36_14900 [Mucilaginibacter rubeus]|nr:hypothetical protein DIU36_14900 [Mucilaginibacter rubeus]
MNLIKQLNTSNDMKTTFLTTRNLISQIPSITWVDKDKGQLENYDSMPPIPPNSVLITVNINRTQEIGDGRKIWFVSIIIRFYADVVKSETSNKAPDEAVERSLKYYDDVEAIYDKLQDYTDNELDTFNMQSAAEESRRDGLTIMRFVFNTSFVRLIA